jgi:hypothetical protein
MTMRLSLALLALATISVSASAQLSTTDRVRDRVIRGGDRSETRTQGTIGDIIFGRGESEARASSRVPRGHLPPRGMCRVWVDGVPPGHQPAGTSCAEAERDRLRYGAGARVIYGDTQSFPGKGKGKLRKGVERFGDDELTRQRRRGANEAKRPAHPARGKNGR